MKAGVSRLWREDDDAEGRESEFGAVLLVVAGDLFGDDGAPVALVAAAEVLAVGVDEFDPAAGAGEAEAVFVADDGGEVEDDGDGATAIAFLAAEAEDAVFGVAAVDPPEAGMVVVGLPEAGFAFVEVVEFFDHGLEAEMVGALIQKIPGEAAAFVPFVALADFAAHEEQFFAREKPFVGEQAS